MSTHLVSVEQFIKTTPAQVYRAFTNATALREWMADVASVEPHPGGRMYLWWKGDFYSSGEYTTLEPNRSIAFTWDGRGDPAPSPVSVTLSEKDGGVLVKLVHTVTDESVIEAYRKEWADSLENLVSVLETGLDLRLTRRPMLGISVGDFTPEQAAHLGTPVTEGIRLDGVVEGMGAQKAGLQKDDVLVELAAMPLTTYNSLVMSLQSKRAGDEVAVNFYRGAEKHHTTMKLSGRPLPEIRFDARWLAETVRERFTKAFAALAEALNGVSEAAASARPFPDEWSAKETLAHLIQAERGTQLAIGDLLASQDRWSDDFVGNQMVLVQATVAAYPTTAELLEELKRASHETIALLAALPDEFVARKGSYWGLAYSQIEGYTHIYTHIEQLTAAFQSAAA